jgi:hypothetical protein
MRNIPSNRPAHSSQALLLQCNITDVATVAGKVKGFLLHCTKILDYQDNLRSQVRLLTYSTHRIPGRKTLDMRVLPDYRDCNGTGQVR